MNEKQTDISLVSKKATGFTSDSTAKGLLSGAFLLTIMVQNSGLAAAAGLLGRRDPLGVMGIPMIGRSG
ncbi:MAG: hypothetical protein RR721_12730 [Aeromonas sp.]|uniref:hypothetical protein n=1 Tax=Aeromonas sp. TaxID=647 RepID=UPI002FCBC030